MSKLLFGTVFFLLAVTGIRAQQGAVSGWVRQQDEPAAGILVNLGGTSYTTQTDSLGRFLFEQVKPGRYLLTIPGKYQGHVKVVAGQTAQVVVKLDSSYDLEELVVKGGQGGAMNKLRNVEGTAIFAAKKSEVINLERVVANTATNNSRQVYARVAGLNIWENDAAGLQLGIGGRGLNPNKVSNFNTRQNGYDISADALGYPESYYTPPVDAVGKIEIVRGAASLQYGTQFGGIINFRMKKPSEKPLEWNSQLTGGSYGFLSTFNSLSGTKGKWSYYSFYQYKRGDGWRPNSHFDAHNAFASVTYKSGEKLSVTGEYTYMHYLAQQPGGLTDAMFKADPSQSIRSRNYFRVNWNLMALYADYQVNSRLRLNTRFFGLLAGKDALGILSYINRADPMTERDLWKDRFTNFGNETRLLYNYKIRQKPATFLLGSRVYYGLTDRQQGLGNRNSTGKPSDFRFVNPGDLEFSAFRFPGVNYAVFAENIFHLSETFTIVPGIRYEFINTRARGFYNLVNYDLAGNIIYKERIDERRERPRSLLLGGIGFAWNPNAHIEMYANISQNYRSINFNDIRVVNPNLRVDPGLKDEKGFSADIGIRGSRSYWLVYDISLFLLKYNDRIGSVLMADTQTYNTYRYRTNVSDSRNMGIESYAEIDFLKLLRGRYSLHSLALFTNLSAIDARYIDSRQSAFNGKLVEMVPHFIVRTGLTYRFKKQWAASWQYSYTSQQYTDATNAEFTANAVNGVIPAYSVMDVTLKYFYKMWTFSASVNNLLDARYFTRRADGYPGPGIIPAEPRSVFMTVGLKL